MMKSAELRIKQLEARVARLESAIIRVQGRPVQNTFTDDGYLVNGVLNEVLSETPAQSLLEHDLKLVDGIAFELGANGATGCETILKIVKFNLKAQAERYKQEPCA